ncbi:hypothetical protein H5410_001842 [Solanum commersonii]|uniref:Uncharacterized protein n=1 Tax=Solanum commersonii TaxID=4109 RepID=A0A9J6AZX6_SOLCO|nr:hypothetical protein H5410_001842 [Solanum commersonii]
MFCKVCQYLYFLLSYLLNEGISKQWMASEDILREEGGPRGIYGLISYEKSIAKKQKPQIVEWKGGSQV